MFKALRDFATPVALMVVAGVLLFVHYSGPGPPPTPDATVNGAALGRAFAPKLVAGYAEAWVAAAKVIEDGGTVAAAQGVLRDAWLKSRNDAFTTEVEPGFAIVLPAGTEPADAAKRRQVALLWRSFASGLKGGK